MRRVLEAAATSFGASVAKIAGGVVPQTAHGGDLDGLQYFPIEVSGSSYWLTADGLFDPPKEDEGGETLA